MSRTDASSESMRKPRRVRTFVVLISALLVAGTFGLITSAGATPATFVRLHMASDGRFFQYGSGSGATTQNLTTQSNNCKINSAEPIMHLTATGSQAVPGLNGTDIGVRTNSSGNGTPCGQVDSGESLTLSPSSTGVIAGRTFSAVRLDLEMTGNAVVKLTLKNGATTLPGYSLQTGTSITVPVSGTTSPPYVLTSTTPGTYACAAANSSGPNNAFNDNCEWTVQPGSPFTSVALTTVSVGTVALEGSNDFGGNTAFDTVFFLSDQAPTPQPDGPYAVNQGTTLNVAAPGVLGNDSDPDGNSLTVGSNTQPSHGTATVNSDGSFTYTPTAGYFGGDSFTYSATDGLMSTAATVSINVNATPVASDFSVGVFENASVVVDLLGHVNDPDNGPPPLTAAVVAQPANGSVTNSNGTFTYTPTAGYSGPDSFTYDAVDGGGAVSNTATVSVTVTPVMCTDDTVTSQSGTVIGSFTLLTPSTCKGYSLATDQSNGGSVTFLPSGADLVNFRGFVQFGSSASDPGTLNGSTLQYDPTGGSNYQPVPWCQNVVFDTSGKVTSATVPAGNTWCIASVNTIPDSTGTTTTPIWQVYGHDDPKFI